MINNIFFPKTFSSAELILLGVYKYAVKNVIVFFIGYTY